MEETLLGQGWAGLDWCPGQGLALSDLSEGSWKEVDVSNHSHEPQGFHSVLVPGLKWQRKEGVGRSVGRTWPWPCTCFWEVWRDGS